MKKRTELKRTWIKKVAAVFVSAVLVITSTAYSWTSGTHASAEERAKSDTAKESDSATSGTRLEADPGYELGLSYNDIFASPNSVGFYYFEYASEYDSDDKGYPFKVKYYDPLRKESEDVYSSNYAGYYSRPSEMSFFRNEDELYLLNKVSSEYSYSEEDHSYTQEISYSIVRIDMESSSVKEYVELKADKSFNSFCITDDDRIVLSSGRSLYIYDSKGNYQNTVISEYPESSSDAEEKSDTDDSEEKENTSSDVPYMGCSKIVGYDPSNGNIYYQGSSNWVYWGFDHFMAAAKVANLKTDNSSDAGEQNTITFNDTALSLLYQEEFFDHAGSVEMFDGGYLAVLDTFSGSTLTVMKSENIDLKKITETQTTINPLTSGFSVTRINLSNAEEAAVFSIDTNISYEDNGDVGCRACYNPQNKNFYVMTGNNEISQIDPAEKEITATVKTEYPLYKVMTTDSNLFAVTRDGEDYYVQLFSEKEPSSVKILGEKTLNKGETSVYTAKFDSDFEKNVSFSSSDPGVVSVSEAGKAVAWKAGKADIKVTTEDGELTDTFSVEVKDDPDAPASGSSVLQLEGGVITNNIDESFMAGGSVINSYLQESDDGRIMRVEHTEDGLQVEYYKDGVLDETKKVELPLDIFGGFYKGSGGYYVVSGRSNENEDDDLEVIRVEKYDEDWNLISSCSINSVNTYIPFSAGSLRMTETGGYLYIYTCHTMYGSDGGPHHQSNMTFKIDESDMKLISKFSDVMNLSCGYVSHSFDQFIQTDGEDIYRVDLGDAYPRGIAYTVTDVDSEVSSPSRYGNVFGVRGQLGNNYTGLSIGGLELSDDNALIAGICEADFDASADEDSDDVRNLFVVTVSKSTGAVSRKNITSYDADSKTNVETCRLVKVDGNHFMLLWIENVDGRKEFHYAQLDGDGNTANYGTAYGYHLSDCQPFLGSDGSVMWYASDGKRINLYRIDPYDMESVHEAGEKYKETVKDDEDVSSGGTQSSAETQPSGGKSAYAEISDPESSAYQGDLGITVNSNFISSPKPDVLGAYEEDDIVSGSSMKSGKITINIKNRRKYKITRRVKIKAANGIKWIKVNGHRLKIKKGVKKYSFSLKKYKKYLYRGKKYNKIAVKDKRNSKKNIKFRIN